MKTLKAVMHNKVSRRKFISGVSAGLGATAAVSFAAGCGGNGTSISTTPTPAPTTAITDVDILNFALNLEYLEAEFYLRAVTGSGLAAADIGANPGPVTGGAKVPFGTVGNPPAVSTAIQQYAVEIAGHEQMHVQRIRALITSLGGTPVDRPAIDFTDAFTAAAVAAKVPGGAFNPFADENQFALGSFVFEDVGVTAYNGAGALIQSKTTVLPAAGGIVAVEAYHAGLIRYLINAIGPSLVSVANLISALRGTASAVTGTSGAAETMISSSTLVPVNMGTSLAFVRDTDQILHIVYLSPTAGVVSKGGFYPNGMNGTITASAS